MIDDDTYFNINNFNLLTSSYDPNASWVNETLFTISLLNFSISEMRMYSKVVIMWKTSMMVHNLLMEVVE